MDRILASNGSQAAIQEKKTVHIQISLCSLESAQKNELLHPTSSIRYDSKQNVKCTSSNLTAVNTSLNLDKVENTQVRKSTKARKSQESVTPGLAKWPTGVSKTIQKKALEKKNFTACKLPNADTVEVLKQFETPKVTKYNPLLAIPDLCEVTSKIIIRFVPRYSNTEVLQIAYQNQAIEKYNALTTSLGSQERECTQENPMQEKKIKQENTIATILVPISTYHNNDKGEEKVGPKTAELLLEKIPGKKMVIDFDEVIKKYGSNAIIVIKIVAAPCSDNNINSNNSNNKVFEEDDEFRSTLDMVLNNVNDKSVLWKEGELENYLSEYGM